MHKTSKLSEIVPYNVNTVTAILADCANCLGSYVFVIKFNVLKNCNAVS